MIVSESEIVKAAISREAYSLRGEKA